MARTRDSARERAETDARSPGRPPIPVERIVREALKIVDREGAEALSMRTLAERLGSGTATLYRHFPSRAALVEQVVDLIFAQPAPETTQRGKKGWEASCRAIALAMFDTLLRHRNMTPMLVEQIPMGPRATAFRERFIGTLLAHGFPRGLALRFYATLARYALGFAIQAGGSGADAEPRTTKAMRAPGTNLANWSPISLQDEFAFGLDLILRGMRQVRAAASR